MSAAPRRTRLGSTLDGRAPRALAGPSLLLADPPGPSVLEAAAVHRATSTAETFELEAGRMEIDRRVRREHMRVTIPFRGPSPRSAQDDINRLLKASMADSASLERLRAVRLEVRETVVVLSAAGAAHCVEHWLDGTRLADAVLAAIDATSPGD